MWSRTIEYQYHFAPHGACWLINFKKLFFKNNIREYLKAILKSVKLMN